MPNSRADLPTSRTLASESSRRHYCKEIKAQPTPPFTCWSQQDPLLAGGAARARAAAHGPTLPLLTNVVLLASGRSEAVGWTAWMAADTFGSSCAASFARRGPAPLRLLQQAGVALDAPAPLFGLAVAGCMRSVHVQRPSAGRMWGMLSHQSHRAVAACCEAPAYGRYKPVRCMQLS